MCPAHAAIMKRLPLDAALIAVALAASARPAHGYTISTVATEGCHERVSSEALRSVRRDSVAAPAIAPTDDEKALIADLQFTPDDDMKDLAAVTFLLAVRDNDLKGNGSADLSALSEVHGSPATQREHCLRGANQVEPSGSQAALADCKAFIRERIGDALDALDASGKPDPGKRVDLSIHLAIRGTIDASLPAYYVRLGQAVHAVQDSFTHTYRTSDGMKITVMLDWTETINGTTVESVNGPSHATALDVCNDPDDLRTTRRTLATEATAAVLRATLDPATTREQKLAAVDVVLDRYLDYSPGCTSDNGWCNAPERQYKDPAGCGCTTGSIRGGLGAAGAGIAIALLLVARRIRRQKERARAAIAIAIGAGAIVLLVPRAARADEPETSTVTTTKPAKPATPTKPAVPQTTTTTTTIPGSTPQVPATTQTTISTPTMTTTTVTAPVVPDPRAPPPPELIPVVQPGPRDPSKAAFGAYGGFSGSLQKAALGFTVGARLRVSKSWAFGVDGEWNPWIAFTGTNVHTGVANVYGTAILRVPLAYEQFNLRTTANLGVSYLLSSFYGAPEGTLGLYAGLSPLGLEWKLSRIFYVILNPLNVALAAPQLSGVPLVYPQFRSTIGLEIYGG